MLKRYNSKNKEVVIGKRNRISILGLLKFLASLLIIWRHINSIIPPNDYSYFLNSTHIFVEFFFIVTGYMTFKHFQKDKRKLSKTVENKAKESIKYTIKKIKPLIPFILLSVLVTYGIQIFICGIDFNTIKNITFDIAFLSSQHSTVLVQLWYISAMIIVFPIFCIMCQTKNKNLLISVLLPLLIIYYFNFDFGYMYISAIARAICGLSLGIIVYCISKRMESLEITKIGSIMLSISELLLFIAVLLIISPSEPSFIENDNNVVIILICFICELALLFSGTTLQSKITCSLFDYLEKLSLPIYLLHIGTIMYVNNFIVISVKKQIVLIYLITLILSAASYQAVIYFSNRRTRKG